MKLRNIALLASLTVFAAAVSAAPKKAPAKPAPAKVDPKVAKAEAEAKAKAEAEAKAKAEAAKAPEGPPDKMAGVNFGGNLVQGYTFNPSNPADGYNGTLTWTDRANEYQLNQAWMYFEIPTDTSKKDFDWGMRVDTMFGSSYRWATSAGFEDKFKTNTGDGSVGSNGVSTAGSQYGLAIPTAYFDLAYKSVKLRMGHIISPVGFFTVDTTQNVFNTIPYTYQYGEPFTHWGAWLYWTVNDKLSLMGGATHGGDNLDGSGTGAKAPGFLGTLTYVFDDKSTFDWVVHISKEYNYKTNANSAGDVPDPVAGQYNGADGLYSWRYFQTLVYKRNLTSSLQWVLQSDLGVQKVADVKAAAGGVNGQEVTATWFGANTYLIWQALQTLQLAVNLEWFRDNNGIRVGSALPTVSAASTKVAGMLSTPTRGNYIGNFFQVTFGPKWQPTKNFFLRVNGRYDYFQGDALNANASSPALPFNNGTKRDQFVVGIDAALLF